jgi:hypothetical protein
MVVGGVNFGSGVADTAAGFTGAGAGAGAGAFVNAMYSNEDVTFSFRKFGSKSNSS